MRKGSQLRVLVEAGLVRDGELLRYKSKQGAVMAVGRAHAEGIEVHGNPKLLGYTAFEATSGSTYHRPAEHTHTSRGVTLQALQLAAAGAGVGFGARKGGAPEGPPLLEDDNDDLCYLCGLGVSAPAPLAQCGAASRAAPLLCAGADRGGRRQMRPRAHAPAQLPPIAAHPPANSPGRPALLRDLPGYLPHRLHGSGGAATGRLVLPALQVRRLR